ncbi:hypothetical protein XM38_017410 [Halomicronema hongdechloris C2206]|uniref:HEPN domain-containing protein n=1 Tax=Halomicronema hongdechloris C2206 TaxID=1641165 RepID=A0A1Z3HKF1_9CYAN|nr:HEPN domain-containing protein [Halomicronema hongdechloris]ASC70794.1 hypothetical protein XM38_017410 [Halomicronema hongdechloris C2206]
MSSVSRLLNLAGEDLETSQLLSENKRYRACVSRAHYAMYYATQALLIQQITFFNLQHSAFGVKFAIAPFHNAKTITQS